MKRSEVIAILKKVKCTCYLDGTHNELMNMDADEKWKYLVECERCKSLRKAENGRD